MKFGLCGNKNKTCCIVKEVLHCRKISVLKINFITNCYCLIPDIIVLGTLITVSLIPCVTNQANLVYNLFLVYLFINLYMFRGTMCPSSGETAVFIRHLVLVILCGWLSGMQGDAGDSTLHTGQSSTQNNKYRVSDKHSCFSWWWVHSRPKHVEIDKQIY